MTDTHIVKATPAPLATTKPMHPLVQSAMDHGNLNPAILADLLKVQRDWEAGEAKKAFTDAMVALKRDLPTVLDRDKTVRFETSRGVTTYQHTTLAAAVDQIVPALSQHGFSHSWTPSTAGNKVQVTCTLTHRDGHQETATIDAPPDTSGSKNAGQAVASTITLLQRYTLLSLLGIATRDMVEPGPSDKPATVDARKNLAAVGKLGKLGISVADAEAHIQRGHKEWTSSDLEAIGKWVEGRKPGRVPGEEG